MKKTLFGLILGMSVMGLLAMRTSLDQKGNAEVEKIDNVYVFINSKPTIHYDTIFKFYTKPISYNQLYPLIKYYKSVVKSAYKKDEEKPFDGILFSSNDGYHYAIRFNQ